MPGVTSRIANLPLARVIKKTPAFIVFLEPDFVNSEWADAVSHACTGASPFRGTLD